MKKYLSIALSLFVLQTACPGDGPNFPSTKESPDETPLPAEPKIISFTVSMGSITEGQEITLTWETSDAQRVMILPDIGDVDLSGSLTLIPEDSTDYVLIIPGAVSSDILNVTVTPVSQPEPGPEPEPEPTRCESHPLSAEELAIQLHLSAPKKIIPGEGASLNWKVIDEDDLITSQLLVDDELISTELSGEESFIPKENLRTELIASRCGIEASVSVDTDQTQWQQERENVSVMATGAGRVWIGGRDGSLSVTHDGSAWTHFDGGRTSRNDGTKDDTPISAIARLDSLCGDALYFGTESGNLYRSQDDGSTVKGLKGGNYPMAYFTKDMTPPYATPSPVRWIASTPDKKLYVGHDAGLVVFEDCTNPDPLHATYLFAHQQVIAGFVDQDQIYALVDRSIQKSNDGIEWHSFGNRRAFEYGIDSSTDPILAEKISRLSGVFKATVAGYLFESGENSIMASHVGNADKWTVSTGKSLQLTWDASGGLLWNLKEDGSLESLDL